MRVYAVSLLIVCSLAASPVAAWAEPAPLPATTPTAAPTGGPVVIPAETPTAVDETTAAQETAMADKRRDQLTWHQGLALAALLGMIATGVVGQVLHSQRQSEPNVDALTAVHVSLASATTLLYGGAATLALTAPPPTQPSFDKGGGIDQIVLHRGVSWLHAATLGATVTLGLMSLFNVPGLAPTHQVLAWTTTGLMALSGGLIVLNF